MKRCSTRRAAACCALLIVVGFTTVKATAGEVSRVVDADVSPDGKELAMVVVSPRGTAPASAVQGEDTPVAPQSAVVAAWRFRDESAAPRVIMRTEAPYSIGHGITWHPKERKLAFTALSADLKTAGSWVGSIDLETGRYLTHTREDEAKRWARSPRWSPDGRFLAYVSRRTPVSPSTKDSAKILNVVDMDRGMVSVVPETRLSVWDTWAWDVDGATMFCSYGDEGGIWAVNIVTGQKSLLVADHVMSWPADVSPAGDALSYLNLHDPMVLHIARRGRSRGAAISPDFAWFAQLGCQGGSLCWCSGRRDQVSINSGGRP